MPEYTYHCSACGIDETLEQPRGSARTNDCPCGSQRCRVVGRFGYIDKFHTKQSRPEGRYIRDGMLLDETWAGQTYQHVHDENGQPLRFKSGTKEGQMAELKEAAEAQARRNNPNAKEPITFDVKETI
jgi:hypothetical protein